ncbi:DUF6880 family protein [Mycoavidus sp. SF9855]|uniref:DUF6880 family protein n=1 Tax=Mycoavidus sp. SF9855 TaxID=2968475 RepID=UPI00211C8D23|nr:DUF6880 family protein [Mycoavidus sp. SF9855]UUM21348.1 hypothetical protein NQD60_07920 [Mycoavidus sp. SF9855]
MMPSSKTITADNLIALGADRLAAILYSLSQEDAHIKQRLRLALAEQAGIETVANEVKKRLASLKRSQAAIACEKIHALKQDLYLQYETIVERIAPKRPDLALELLWLFMGLAPSIYERSYDRNNDLSMVFHQPREDLGGIAQRANPEPMALANQTFTAIKANDYGQYEGLVEILFPALGQQGVAHLKAKINAALAIHPKRQDNRFDYQERVLVRALQDLADQEKDVDAYIALTTAAEQRMPHVAAQIAHRLLNAGRGEEAMTALLEGHPQLHANRYHASSHEWDKVYLETLDATNRTEEAQTIRLEKFDQHLNSEALRAYLKRLPAFDQAAVEEKALAYALQFPNAVVALNFFSSWPSLSYAAQLTLTRTSEIDGDACYSLDETAQQLAGSYPLAATLLRRAMIEAILRSAKSKRYRHAVRHLAECQSLDNLISCYEPYVSHQTFVATLRTAHSRKSGFWAHMKEFGMDQPIA